jgi:hypothetical protein
MAYHEDEKEEGEVSEESFDEMIDEDEDLVGEMEEDEKAWE